MSFLLAVPKLESHSTCKTSSGSRPSRWRPRYKSFEPSITGPAIFCFSLVQGLWVIRCRPVRVFVFSFNIPPHGLSAHTVNIGFPFSKQIQSTASRTCSQPVNHSQTKPNNRTKIAVKFLILVSGSGRDWGFGSSSAQQPRTGPSSLPCVRSECGLRASGPRQGLGRPRLVTLPLSLGPEDQPGRQSTPTPPSHPYPLYSHAP